MEYNGKNLEQVLALSRKYSEEYPNGNPEDRAIFTHSDLRHANLRNAKLVGAYFKDVNLRYSDLGGSILSHAEFEDCFMEHAFLRKIEAESLGMQNVDLSYSDISESHITCSYFNDCHFDYSRLVGLDFREVRLNRIRAGFIEADSISACDISGHDVKLERSDLSNSYLCRVSVKDLYLSACCTEGMTVVESDKINIPLSCPDTGAFIGWKKCICENGTHAIVKLQIYDTSERVSGGGRKCRCSKAKVLEIQDLSGSRNDIKEARSIYANEFVYVVGHNVKPLERFEKNRWEECSSGIHFFITRKEAVDY